MTKKQMIAMIQKAEATAWLELKKAILLFGRDADRTSINRREWSALHDLMNSLNIESDLQLPDNLEARLVQQMIFDKEEKVM
jgi:hypothetical protein